MSPALLSGPAAVRVVARREVQERLRSGSVRWGTLAMVALAAAVALAPIFLPDSGDAEYTLALTADVPAGLVSVLEANASSSGIDLTIDSEAQRDVEALAADDDVDAVLVDDGTVLSDGTVPDDLSALLTRSSSQYATSEQLSAFGVTADEQRDVLSIEPVEFRTLDEDDGAARQGVAFLGTLVLFVAIVTYGTWIMNSVLEEKANRIVEIIVSAVKPSELLAGKVLGVGAIALAQLGLVVTTGAGIAGAAGTLPQLPDFVAGTVLSTLLWFLLGFGFYAVAYAAAGSLTSRQEEAQSAVAPLTGIVTIAYLVTALVVNPDPEAPLAVALSFVPPITPLAMPVRMAAGAAAPWEVLAAVAVMLVATWLMTRAAAKVYSGSLLRSGGRIKVLTALRARGD